MGSGNNKAKKEDISNQNLGQSNNNNANSLNLQENKQVPEQQPKPNPVPVIKLDEKNNISKNKFKKSVTLVKQATQFITNSSQKVSQSKQEKANIGKSVNQSNQSAKVKEEIISVLNLNKQGDLLKNSTSNKIKIINSNNNSNNNNSNNSNNNNKSVGSEKNKKLPHLPTSTSNSPKIIPSHQNFSYKSPQRKPKEIFKSEEQNKLKAILRESSIKQQQQINSDSYSLRKSVYVTHLPEVKVRSSLSLNISPEKLDQLLQSKTQTSQYPIQLQRDNLSSKQTDKSFDNFYPSEFHNSQVQFKSEGNSQERKQLEIIRERGQLENINVRQMIGSPLINPRPVEQNPDLEKRKRLLKQKRHYQEISHFVDKSCGGLDIQAKKNYLIKVLPYLEQPIILPPQPIKYKSLQQNYHLESFSQKSEDLPQVESRKINNNIINISIDNINLSSANKSIYQSKNEEQEIQLRANSNLSSAFKNSPEQKERWSTLKQQESYLMEQADTNNSHLLSGSSRIRTKKLKHVTKQNSLQAEDVQKIFQYASYLRKSRADSSNIIFSYENSTKMNTALEFPNSSGKFRSSSENQKSYSEFDLKKKRENQNISGSLRIIDKNEDVLSQSQVRALENENQSQQHFKDSEFKTTNYQSERKATPNLQLNTPQQVQRIYQRKRNKSQFN